MPTRQSLSVCVCVLLAAPAFAQSGSLVISEIGWMGTTSGSADEWLELTTTTGAPVDLSGWTLEATTLTGASAAVSAIKALRAQALTVRSLQDYYAATAAPR